MLQRIHLSPRESLLTRAKSIKGESFIFCQMDTDAEKGRKWSRPSLEILIEAYQQHECLYDTKNRNYFNRKRKRDALNTILRKLKDIRPHTSIAEIKYKLKTMRIQFVQEYKKVQLSNKSGASPIDLYEPKAWWYESLIFLRDHVGTRKSRTNIPESPSTAESEEMSAVTKKLEFVEVDSEHVLSPALMEQQPVKGSSQKNSTNIKKRLLHNQDTWHTFGEFVGQSLAGIKNKKLAKQMKHKIIKIIMEGEENDD